MKNVVVILHIISSLCRGGRERQLAIIAKHCENIDNRIIYYNESIGGYIEQYQIEDKVYRCEEKSSLKRIQATIKYARDINADIIVSWGNMESIIGLLVSAFTDIPFVNFSIRHGIRSRKFSHYFRTLVLHLSKNIVANSHAGLKANNLRRGHVLYNGIEAVEVKENHSLDAKRIMFITDDDPVIILVSVANLVPYKDYFTVFESLKKLKDEGFLFRYYVIGEGPLRVEYEEYLRKNQLEDDIFLLGRIIYPHAFLSHADVFVHSSKGEGCSNAILEAMYMGLPIIASDTGGTSEIVEDNAILFPYKDNKELQTAIKQLIQDRELRLQMGKESKIIYEKRFSLERMLKEYEDIMIQILIKNKK